MESKEEVLEQIKSLAQSGLLQKGEVLDAFNAGVKKEGAADRKIGMAEILYYIGGAIVFIGVAIFVFQNWRQLSPQTRTVSTLGSAIAAYFAAVFFSLKQKTKNVGLAFHLIGALLMPLGLYVTFHEAGFNVTGAGPASLISAILFAVYLMSFMVFKDNLFIFFSTIFGTWVFFSFTDYLLGPSPVLGRDFFAYRILAAGVAYMLLGYGFSDTKRQPLTPFLYGFGVLGFLGAALYLGGWKPHQKVLWELSFPLFVFGALFLSVYLKSKSFLTFGTIFLMLYIIKITGEYFSGSIGWPLSLVIIGLLLIASGYLFIYLKNKYISQGTKVY